MDFIKDPILRDILRNEQKRIYEKMAHEQQFEEGNGSSNAFDKYFDRFGGSGDDFPNF